LPSVKGDIGRDVVIEIQPLIHNPKIVIIKRSCFRISLARKYDVVNNLFGSISARFICFEALSKDIKNLPP